jgi:hypothetical protein
MVTARVVETPGSKGLGPRSVSILLALLSRGFDQFGLVAHRRKALGGLWAIKGVVAWELEIWVEMDKIPMGAELGDSTD